MNTWYRISGKRRVATETGTATTAALCRPLVRFGLFVDYAVAGPELTATRIFICDPTGVVRIVSDDSNVAR